MGIMSPKKYPVACVGYVKYEYAEVDKLATRYHAIFPR